MYSTVNVSQILPDGRNSGVDASLRESGVFSLGHPSTCGRWCESIPHAARLGPRCRSNRLNCLVAYYPCCPLLIQVYFVRASTQWLSLGLPYFEQTAAMSKPLNLSAMGYFEAARQDPADNAQNYKQDECALVWDVRLTSLYYHMFELLSQARRSCWCLDGS